MNLQPKYFEKIKEGTKIIECRLFDEKRKKLKIGDIIEFSNTNNSEAIVKTEIIDLLKYATFEELLENFPAPFFGSDNKVDILDDLYKYYTLDQEKKYSVVGIKIKLI